MSVFKYRVNKLRFLIILKKQLVFQTFYYSIFKNDILVSIINENRKFLRTIDKFLNEDIYKNNDYGIQRRIYEKLESEISELPTYSDFLILIISLHFKNKINYLEIGVSVLKNFLQINNGVFNSNLIAYDINKINPNFKNLDSISKNGNSLRYFEGSVLDRIDALEFNSKFNYKYDLIFSDALHEPDAIRKEYELLIKDNLKEEFLIYYDDLDFQGVEKELINIHYDLEKHLNKKLNLYTLKIYGWIGQHEKLHKNGIITSIDFENFLKKNNLKFYGFKKIK